MIKKYTRILCLPLLIILLAMPILSTHVAAFDPFKPSTDPTAICGRVDSSGNPLPDSPVCNTNGSNPITGKDGLITKAANIFAVVTGVAAIIMIIIGGFEYVRSGGESAKIDKAKNTILFAVIGLVVVVVARSVVALVISRLS